MLHYMTQPTQINWKWPKIKNRIDNLEGAWAFLTGKKNGKILRFSIFDGIPKKKFEKKNSSGDSP